MRKLFILTIAMVCFGFLSKAQISKGSLYFGGSVAYSQSKDENTAPSPVTNENTNFTIAPAVGLALKENLIAGIDFSYNKYENTNNAPGYSSGHTRVSGAGVFLRRYYPIAKKFYAFGQARVGYFDKHGELAENTGTARSTTDGWGLDAGIYPGITYNIAKAFYLEMGFNNLLNISYAKEERTVIPGFGNPSTIKQSSFSVGSSLSSGNYLNVGVRFIVPKK